MYRGAQLIFWSVILFSLFTLWQGFWIHNIDPQKEVDPDRCPASNNVIANGELVGCTKDKQSAANMWTPKHWTPNDLMGRDYSDVRGQEPMDTLCQGPG